MKLQEARRSWKQGKCKLLNIPATILTVSNIKSKKYPLLVFCLQSITLADLVSSIPQDFHQTLVLFDFSIEILSEILLTLTLVEQRSSYWNFIWWYSTLYPWNT